jgi:hypothetical protein
MKLKKQEFLALKQGAMSVSEYRDKFIQLSRYAPADVVDDEEKQDHFKDGVKTKKLWLKHGSRGLFVKDLN